MLFNSLSFLLFFPIVVIVYFLIPKRVKYIWLLISSYYFYMSWNPKYALLMMICTLLTWLAGKGVSFVREKGIKRRRMLEKFFISSCCLVNFSILFFSNTLILC